MLKRTQHPEFGAEIRKLIGGSSVEQEIAGIIHSEANALLEYRNRGSQHPDEKRLYGDDLRDISELQLYKRGQSIRVYFVVHRGELVMLGLDAGKRRDKISKGTEQQLLKRLREVYGGS